MIRVKIKHKPKSILHFDIENRPLSYLSKDYTTAEITGIAASFAGSNTIHCWLLGLDDPKNMLLGFKKLYDETDIVTGHYIRKHDLPMINGALLELQLPPLGEKLTSDTYLDLIKRQGISASQENLAAMYRLPVDKYSMNQAQWREANRLTAEGIDQTRMRVMNDVMQHKALRKRLCEAGALKPARMWRP